MRYMFLIYSRETDMAGACTNEFDTGFVALGYAKVAVLGVVQGITELMPISSTAHMRIVPALLGLERDAVDLAAAKLLHAFEGVIVLALLLRGQREQIPGDAIGVVAREPLERRDMTEDIEADRIGEIPPYLS